MTPQIDPDNDDDVYPDNVAEALKRRRDKLARTRLGLEPDAEEE